MKRIIYFLFFLLATITTSQAQNISSKEKKVLKQVEINNDDALGFLEQTVNINSGTMNAEGVR